MKHLAFEMKQNLFRPGARAVYAQLLVNQKMDEGQLSALQIQKFDAIYQHARSNIEFYRDKYSGLDLNCIRFAEDIERIPLLTRDEIRNHGKQILDIGQNRSFAKKVTTGGSTGVPLEVYHDKRFPLEALGWRTLGWWGIHPGDNVAFIYRIQKRGWRWRFNQLLWFPTIRLFLDASLITDDSMSRFVESLAKHKPPILQGYVGGVIEFAKYCDERGIRFPFLKAVWVTSAPLGLSQRRFLENVFKAPVYDQYGCSEIFWIAAECEFRDGLHILADSRYVEILGDDSKPVEFGEHGDIVLTDLDNYIFPLIRYKTDDRGALKPGNCQCGMRFPLMRNVQGRVSDTIKLPDGTSIAGEYLTTIFDDAPEHVRAFQLRQNSRYDLCLYCEANSDSQTLNVCEKKRQALEELTGGLITVNLEIVDSIKHDRGKTKFIISDVTD